MNEPKYDLNKYNLHELIYKIKRFNKKKQKDIVNKRFTKNQRRRLKNDNFSIISSNCIGGFIYHRLGKQFLSPTINLYFNQKEFLKFVKNLDYYLQFNLRFIKTDLGHPVAELGDIKLFFLHYYSDDEAKLA